MSTTVRADFFVPVGSDKRVLAAPMVADFSGDFAADFASASRGIAPVEAGTWLDRDTAAAAEATAAARADPRIAREAVSSIRADANLALANAASAQADAPLAREFAASNPFHLLPAGEWLIAQRSESTAPAESLLRARADAFVTAEAAAWLSLAPVMPTEQNSAAAALLPLSPAESGALLPSDAIFPGESRSGAALKVGALLSIEALGSTPVDSPVGGESITSMRGGGMAGSEWLVLSRADGAAPVAAATAWLRGVPLAAELAGRLAGDYPLLAEALAAAPGDFPALLELIQSLRIDPRLPIETAGAALLSDAALAVEILRVARGDAPVAEESWGIYVVGVTLTLSDGRVITFATAAP
jgi:hypothetical protein